MSHIPRPMQHLITAGKVYPDAWKAVEMMLSGKGRDLPVWPEWCFIPMAGWYSIVCQGNKVEQIISPALISDVGKLAAIGTWRYSQGIYRFDNDFLSAVVDTPLAGDIPVDVLLRLPELCVYIETPKMEWGGLLLHGFWAHLEWDANTGRRELRFLLDLNEALIPVPFHIGAWTVSEALERTLDVASRQTVNHSLAIPRTAGTASGLAGQFQPLLSMLLYLCTDAPEVTDNRFSPGKPHYRRPLPKKTKRGFRLFPPDSFRIWEVGTEIGNVLRASTQPRESRRPQKGKRTHVRHHHWHGYWSGPRDGERKFHYKWQPTIIVNAAACTDASCAPETDQT